MRLISSLFILFYFGFLPSANGTASELRGILRNNEGVKQLNDQRADNAITDFTAALGDLPFSGEVHLNIGNAFLASRDLERAFSEYEQALKASKGDNHSSRETRFRALFNSAIVRTEMKQNEEALELYQKALEIYPDSIETKTNMELLMRQMAGGGGESENDQKNDKDQSGKDQQKDDQKNDQKNEQNEGEGQDKKDQQKEPDKFENPRSTPRPFKSEELSQQDAKRILDEMKRQEEQIRARMQNERIKERPPEKDW